MKDGKPNFCYTVFEIGDVTISGTVKLPERAVTLKTEFIPDGVPEGAGTLKLYVNDQPAGAGHLTRTLSRHGLEPFEVGRDSITAIAPEYQDQGKFEFTGQIEQVAFALK